MAHTKGKLIFDESVKVITFKKKKKDSFQQKNLEQWDIQM